MNPTVHRIISLLIGAVLLAGLTLGKSQAQDVSLGKLGLTVSPPTQELTVKPGESVTETIKITNPIHDIMTLYPVTLNFTTDNDKGQPTFYTLKEHSSKYSLSDWISFQKPFARIAPGEVEEFAYTVTAPSDAEPGGHYGAVLFSTEPPKIDPNSSNVSVVGLIGTLVLATVPGDIVQRLSLEDFNAPTFLINPPAAFSLTFNNMGNIHLKPYGDIRINNMFGKTVTRLKINEGLGNILPESLRTFAAKWKFDWKQVGKYTATATIAYGTPEQTLTAVRTFYIIPIWLIIFVGLLVLLIVWLIIRRKRLDSHPPFSRPLPPPANPKPRPPRIVMR